MEIRGRQGDLPGPTTRDQMENPDVLEISRGGGDTHLHRCRQGHTPPGPAAPWLCENSQYLAIIQGTGWGGWWKSWIDWKKKKSEWKDSDLTGFSLKWLGLSYATRQGWGLRLKFNSVIGQNSVPLRVACGLLGHPCSLGLSYLTLKSFSSGFRLLLCSVLRGK